MEIEDHFSNAAASGELRYVDMEIGSISSNQALQFTADGLAHVPNIDRRNRRYLVASITKPVVAMSVLRLAAEGRFSLTERIGSFLPAFDNSTFRRITIHHLLTHTSGLPDTLDDNLTLRAAHASLPEFLSRATVVTPEFAPGSAVRYSSVGYLMLGALVEEITCESLPQFLDRTFFKPLRMNDTWLGLDEAEADTLLPTIVPCELPAWQTDADEWCWNSRYWLTLGAPWGGMISTVSDLGRFAAMILNDGQSPDGQQILPKTAVSAALSDQVRRYAQSGDFAGPHRGWGIGWRRQWPGHRASFGDLVSDECAGHWGATGTLLWIDPKLQRYAVILTSTPYEKSGHAIQRLSNFAAATP